MTAPNLTPMTEAEFETAKSATLDPIQCIRCGRWLYSRASIVRGFGSTCAFAQALEELSHDRRPQVTELRPKPTVEFYEVSKTVWEAVDYRDVVVGELKRDGQGAWKLYLWGTFVDLDMDLANAKKRLVKILEKMAR